MKLTRKENIIAWIRFLVIITILVLLWYFFPERMFMVFFGDGTDGARV